jgi:hypothetical protein
VVRSVLLEDISSTPRVEARFLECDLGNVKGRLLLRGVDGGLDACRRCGPFDGGGLPRIHRLRRSGVLGALRLGAPCLIGLAALWMIAPGAPLRVALGAALRATLGIPRGSIGSQAVGVRADRLAIAARARGQRLAVGAEPRLGRLLRL